MKRLPLILNVLAVAALSASCAYWALQLYKPEQRPIAAPPPAASVAPDVASASGLFGGAQVAAVASNYQLTGVVSAGRDSVAIIVADGSPPKAVRLGREVTPGVVLQEVYPRYVMLSENGVAKRIDLPQVATSAPDYRPPVPAAATPALALDQVPVEDRSVEVPAQASVEVPGTTTNAPGPLAPAPGQGQAAQGQAAQGQAPQGQAPQAHEPQPAFMQQQPPVRMPPPVPATGVRTEPQTR